MLSGVNYIDLNRKHKVEQKRIDGLSNNKQARIIKAHINYIGRCEGAENNGDHSLFGAINNCSDISKLKKDNILEYIDKKAKEGMYFYKTVISITETDAEKYGFLRREPWENMIRAKIDEIAKQYKINFNNLDWVASLHTEEGHIHCHLVFFDRENKKTREPMVYYDKIRRELNKEVYKEDIKQLQESQNLLKSTDYINNAFKTDLDFLIRNPTEKLFNNKISDKKLNEIEQKLKSFYTNLKEYQKENNKKTFKKQYLPDNLKSELRELSETFKNSSGQIKNNVELYLLASIRQENILSGNSEKDIIKVKNSAYEFMMNKFDNQILQYIKEEDIKINPQDYIKQNKKSYYNSYNFQNNSNYSITNNLSNLLNTLSNSSYDSANTMKNYNKATLQNLETKAAKKEWYLKHKDVGMVNFGDSR